MSSEFLDSYIENSASDIEETVPELLQKVDFDTAIELSFYYRQNASCQYLLTGNTTAFVDNMHRSAGSFLYFLQTSKEQDKRTSENEPYFDAIVGGFMKTVGQMAKYSRSSCNFDYEYEDDFLYTHFLLSYFFREADGQKILSDYEAVLEGDDDVRFDLCKSFFEKDPDMFNDKFEQFLVERDENMIKMISRETVGEDIWSWSKYISMEGLALLKLASLLNFKTNTNYKQIPEGLRYLPETEFNSNLWQSIS